MKTTHFLGFGVLFRDSGAATCIELCLYMLSLSGRLQSPDERVSFGADSYVGRRHI